MAKPQGRYPLGKKGKLIGTPYVGSHTLYGNWESDNAIDLATPSGTPVYAVADGKIGSQIGALSSSDPHLLGLRLHLETKGNEWYYAHLSRLVVKAGQRVKAGQLLGYSGSANGVDHLHISSKHGDPRSLLGFSFSPTQEHGQPPAPEPDAAQEAPAEPQAAPVPGPEAPQASLPVFTPPSYGVPPDPEDALPTIRTADTLGGIPEQYDFTRAWQEMAQLPFASDETKQNAAWALTATGLGG